MGVPAIRGSKPAHHRLHGGHPDGYASFAEAGEAIGAHRVGTGSRPGAASPGCCAGGRAAPCAGTGPLASSTSLTPPHMVAGDRNEAISAAVLDFAAPLLVRTVTDRGRGQRSSARSAHRSVDHDHPGGPEAVGAYAVRRREERLADGHLDLTALGQ